MRRMDTLHSFLFRLYIIAVRVFACALYLPFNCDVSVAKPFVDKCILAIVLSWNAVNKFVNVELKDVSLN